ncbi:MAG: class I SAM-dependent methyltransferase [Acidobacteriota bacterium]
MDELHADPGSIETADGGPGQTTLSWKASIERDVEIRVGSPQGPLFARGGQQGSAQTGPWVKDQTAFYLLDAKSGETLATATVRVKVKPPSLQALSQRMQDDWDRRSRENAFYYVASSSEAWSEEEFFQSGRQTFEETFREDMPDICRGRDPRRMRVLEVGCGVGRILRAAADEFGEVCGVDVSPEMIRKARRYTASCSNVSLFANNGIDLQVLGDRRFDFAYSLLCFQHIPSKQVIEGYIRQTCRLLRPGGLFKFQVQGFTPLENPPDDTWLGAAFSTEELTEMAHRCGFQPRRFHGEGSQYLYVWFYKKGPASLAARPNPVPVKRHEKAQLALTWDAPTAQAVEIRIGSPTGDLLAKTAPYGTRSIAIPAPGKADYFLLDASSLETLASLIIRTRPAWLNRVLSWASRSPARNEATK